MNIFNYIKDRKDFFQLLVILLTGGVIGIAQMCSTQNTATNQQKLYALQTFKDNLTGNRLSREMTLRILDNLEDKCLSKKLRVISDEITIESLRDSIWNDSASVRENAIIEYAQLYNKKEYRSQILDALIPRYYHLEHWAPTISIAKFFYYLTIYSNGTWWGTKKDLARFATIKQSKYYKYPELIPGNNLKKYLEYCFEGFKDTIIDYRETHLRNLIWNNYENDTTKPTISDLDKIKGETLSGKIHWEKNGDKSFVWQTESMNKKTINIILQKTDNDILFQLWDTENKIILLDLRKSETKNYKADLTELFDLVRKKYIYRNEKILSEIIENI